MALRRRNRRVLESNVKPQNNIKNSSNSNNLETGDEDLEDLILDFSPEIPEGQCKFCIAHVDMEKNVQTDQGVRDKIVIKFKLKFNNDGNIEKYNLEKKFNKSKSLNSRIYKMCKLMLGDVRGKRINMKDLMGISGTCEIKYNELPNGNIFPEIINVKIDNETDYLENNENEEGEEDFDE